MSETITVQKVNPKETARGKKLWEVELEDGRTVVTFDEKISQAAFQVVGSPVSAEIREKTNDFGTDYYLNGIGETSESRPAAKSNNGSGASTSAPAPRRGGRDPKEQDRISRQWAMGRAVEMFIASGASFNLPLTEENQVVLADLAQFFYKSAE